MITTLKEKTTETTLLYIISLLTIRTELKRLLLVLPVRVLLLNTVEIVLSNLCATVTLIELM